MKEWIQILALFAGAGLMFGAFSFVPDAQHSENVAGGSGTINTLDQWTGTSSPSTAITQRTYGKDIRLTGYESLTCIGTDSNGMLQLGTCSGGGGGSFPFTATTNFGQQVYATNTPTLWFQGGMFASSTSWFTNYIATNGTTTNATSTNLNVSGQIDFDQLTSALILTGAGGILAEYAGSGCTNQVVEDISALGAANCVSINNGYWSGTDLSVANGGTGASTLTGILQGNGASAFTTITDSSTVGQVLRVTGASTYAWGALDLNDGDAITNDLPFANLAQVSAASLLGNPTGSTADARSVATSTLFGASTPGFVLMWDGSKWAGYATSTCIQITGSADLCDGNDASAAGAADPFTFGLYGGSIVAATTSPLRLTATTPYSLLATSTLIGNASTTNITASSSLYVGSNRVQDYETKTFSYASSTQGMGTTTTFGSFTFPAAATVASAECYFNNFMRVLFQDAAGNRLNDLVASSTVGTHTFSSNNTFTAQEPMLFYVGTTTNIASSVAGNCTVKFRYN